jgi:hypothetical protein
MLEMGKCTALCCGSLMAAGWSCARSLGKGTRADRLDPLIAKVVQSPGRRIEALN